MFRYNIEMLQKFITYLIIVSHSGTLEISNHNRRSGQYLFVSLGRHGILAQNCFISLDPEITYTGSALWLLVISQEVINRLQVIGHRLSSSL